MYFSTPVTLRINFFLKSEKVLNTFYKAKITLKLKVDKTSPKNKTIDYSP